MDTKNVFQKSYPVTEACALTKNGHPVSIFSELHSSKEKDFTSINDVTFSAMERAAALLGKAIFVMVRGYDDNKMFLKRKLLLVLNEASITAFFEWGKGNVVWEKAVLEKIMLQNRP